jgi:hypothetical protein
MSSFQRIDTPTDPNAQAISLATELKHAAHNARGLYRPASLYTLKELALAIETYVASRQNLSAEYTPPAFPPNVEGSPPLSASVHDAFDKALGRNGIYQLIKAVENCKEHSSDITKREALNEIISVGERTIKFISGQLYQTADCPNSLIYSSNPLPPTTCCSISTYSSAQHNV